MPAGGFPENDPSSAAVGIVRGPVARRAWLFRVAANEAALMWRCKATAERVMAQQAARLDDTDSVVSDTTDKIILTETTVRVRQAIERLPQPYQDVIHRRIDQEMTFQQIADELEIPLGTALTRMRRAIDRLRDEMSTD